MGMEGQGSILCSTIRSCAAGFTLIELLVVVGIIGLLAALALSALSRAQARAYRIACVSNMKQFELALHLYAQDHDDRLPPNADGREEALGGQMG
jgi:prepilin-type N-terminal cleavage/methylation domain-containing protein